MKTLRLLLVDDDPADVAIFEDYLEEAPFTAELEVAGNGVEALERLRVAPRPHIVLLDLNMPRMGGKETLQAIRNDPVLEDQPVVVLTTSDRDEDIEATFEHRAQSFVTKPHDAKGFEIVMQLIKDVASTYVWKEGN